MNFLAHALVAGRQRRTSALTVLGAVLPDLAAMARLPYYRDLLPAEVAAGVDLHHATDRVFHADRSFVEGSATLRQAAFDAGVPSGASRAVGHAGWELLLDGRLRDGPEAGHRLQQALKQAPAVLPALGPGAAGGPAGTAHAWLHLTATLAQQRWWLRYGDPLFVAQRLFDMLAGRPRLSFSASGIDQVTAALVTVQPSVAGQAGPLLQRTIEATSSGDGRPLSARRG